MTIVIVGSPTAAGRDERLGDLLGAWFGRRRVVLATGDANGQAHAEAVLRRRRCVVVVLIGPGWGLAAHAPDASPARALVPLALARARVVVPVLVANAPMPLARELPPELAGLAKRQRIEMRDHDFARDAVRLAQALSRHLISRRLAFGMVDLARSILVLGPNPTWRSVVARVVYRTWLVLAGIFAAMVVAFGPVATLRFVVVTGVLIAGIPTLRWIAVRAGRRARRA